MFLGVIASVALVQSHAHADACQAFNKDQQAWAIAGADALEHADDVLLYCGACPLPSHASPYASRGERPKRLDATIARVVVDGEFSRIETADRAGRVTLRDVDIAYAYVRRKGEKRYVNVGQLAHCTWALGPGVPAELDAAGNPPPAKKK